MGEPVALVEERYRKAQAALGDVLLDLSATEFQRSEARAAVERAYADLQRARGDQVN